MFENSYIRKDWNNYNNNNNNNNVDYDVLYKIYKSTSSNCGIVDKSADYIINTRKATKQLSN
ncbi:hypothetical protein PFDG_05305 [Plasmodium falciparum Dd2]|uniref:Uncharacterized protein n=1 Tax=Plasmodium falciparum (isolate Dd2) TaxID=57267 RepID=A0A0L7MA72_PLAF4|nr:hypothetical protein PFDG_05305 [Plasmodium falciparum Dd2]